MPSIQGNHTVQILPRQREVSIQDNWEVDKYIVLANGQVSPSSLSLSVSHSGFTNPLYEWRKYNPQRRTWESINRTSKTISIAPQEDWGNDGFKIGCLVKERDKNGDEGVFAYKPFTRKYLDNASDDTSTSVDGNLWSRFVSGEVSELNIVCSNPNGFTFPEDVGNRLTAGKVSILMHIGWGQNWHPSTWFTNNEIKNADMRVLIPKYVRVFTSDGIEVEGDSIQGNSKHLAYKAKPAWGKGEKGEANSATYEFLFISDGLRRKSYCIWLNRIETRGLEIQERTINSLKEDNEFIKNIKGKDAAPVRQNIFDLSCLTEYDRNRGLSIDEVTEGRSITPLYFRCSVARDTARICTGVAVQYDISINRCVQDDYDNRGVTIRARQTSDNSVIASVRKILPNSEGMYHIENTLAITSEQLNVSYYVDGYLVDWRNRKSLLDFEIKNVKIEYLYDGESQECSSYTPSPSDMIPLLPKIENGEWMLPDQLTRKYLSTGVKAKGEPGAPGKSVTPQEVASVINTESFRGSISNLIKTDATFVAATTGKQGAPGKDAAPIRPNLLKGFMGRDIKLDKTNSNFYYRELIAPKWIEDGKAYVASADFELLDGELPNEASLLFKLNGSPNVYSHTPLNGRSKGRVSIYIPAGVYNTYGVFGYAGRAGNTSGVAAKYSNIKLEEVQEGEPKEASAYLPHTDDLKVPLSSVVEYLKTQGISNEVKELLKLDNKFVKDTKGEKGDDGKTPKVTLGVDKHLYVDGVRQMYSLQGDKGDPGKSVYVSDLHIVWDGTSLVVDGKKSPSLKGEPGASPSALAVANEMNTASFREGLSDVVVTKVTTDPSNLNKIRRGMVVETKYNEDRWKIIKRVEDVEKEIVPFAFVEVGTYSSEWRDYTNDEYVGGGGTPDPWGGGFYDGYIRSVHNYELYRSMQNIPPKYIEQSKKVLKTNEYKIGDKFHRDASATIVYDVQEIQGIDKGSARCWDIFTSPHVDSLLRYGKNTRMANPNMQGQQQGSGANEYWNVYLEKNTNYRIFINNDVGNKYSIYVVKNGAY